MTEATCMADSQGNKVFMVVVVQMETRGRASSLRKKRWWLKLRRLGPPDHEAVGENYYINFLIH